MFSKWLPDGNTAESEATPIVDQAAEAQMNTYKEIVAFDYDDMANRLMHDTALMKTIADLFCQELVGQIDEFKLSIKDNDANQAVAIMHQIKGASANAGGKALSALALEMEQAGKAGSINDMQKNIKQLEHNFNTLKDAMEQGL